jgi:hypothetical protein
VVVDAADRSLFMLCIWRQSAWASTPKRLVSRRLQARSLRGECRSWVRLRLSDRSAARPLYLQHRTYLATAGTAAAGQGTNPLTRERAAREGGASGAGGVTK